MASRIYLPSTGAAPISPAFSTEWDITGSADRIAAVSTRISSAMTAKAIANTTSAGNSDRDRLARQYIFGPIVGSHTITGTIKGQIRCNESATNMNLRSQIVVRAVAPNATTFRGTLYAGDLATLTGDPTSEWVLTTNTNRAFPRGGAQAITSTAVQDGDYLVIELGGRGHSTINFQLGDLVFGDDAGSDLPEDETTTTALNPWIELSYTLSRAGARAYILD